MDKPVKYGMLIDLDKCVGCGTCSISCVMENNIYVLDDSGSQGQPSSWLKIYEINNGKEYPDYTLNHVPILCMHCEEPPCVKVCPVSATTNDEGGGIVSQIQARCIGCRYCMAACPYHARQFNWSDPWPTSKKHVRPLFKALNPDVAPRTRGVVEKCTFCHHRLMRAKEKILAEQLEFMPEDYYQPSCVQSCPVKALVFGDLNNPSHLVSREMVKNKRYIYKILDKMGTRPKIYYLTKNKWIARQLDNFNHDE